MGPSGIAADQLVRHVTSEVVFDIAGPVTIVLQVGVAPALRAEGGLDVRLDDVPVDVDAVVVGTTQAHVLRPPGPGRLVATYRATVTTPAPASRTAPDEAEVLLALRPSRYCTSDQLWGFAQRELAGATAAEVAAWVHGRIRYDIWATNPFDTAIDTLTTGAGVCRDLAHLTIALCRAVGVPARLVAAYAPGLTPMDFHAVVEAVHDGAWVVVDPTRLAPRQSLVRIATGRDAADTAFADTIRGTARFDHVAVTAVVDGELPRDDHEGVVHLA